MGLLVQGRFPKCHVVYPSGRKLWLPTISNGIVTEALNDLLGIMFRAESQLANWYLGLIDDDDFDELDADDSMSSHAGWVESSGYDEATRRAWAPGAAAGGILTNSAAVEFTITSEVTLKGLFVTSNSTKGGTTGTLWATGLYATAVTLPAGAVFKAFYELTARQG